MKCCQRQVGKCPKPIAATSSHDSDSGISTGIISEEISTTLESDNEEVNVITSQGDKSSSHYITVGFPTARGHLKLTTVRIRLLNRNA